MEAQLIELTITENESFEMLNKGELDTYISIDGYGNPEEAVPFYKLGSSDYYFAVTNKRPDVFEELENALNRINSENRYFNQHLYEKYMSSTGGNLFLSPTENDWLASRSAVRVAMWTIICPSATRTMLRISSTAHLMIFWNIPPALSRTRSLNLNRSRSQTCRKLSTL